MININDKNINEILKEKESIEKYNALISILYAVFIKINDLEDSIETKVHFFEAITLFLRLNSRSLFNDDEISIKLKKRYEVNKLPADAKDTALKVELLEDEDEDEANTMKYALDNFISIKKELYLYAKKLYCKQCNFDDFNVYMSSLIEKSIQALDSYKGSANLTNTKLYSLYFFCEWMSITGIFKNDDSSEFFDEEEWKHKFMITTMEIPKPNLKIN